MRTARLLSIGALSAALILPTAVLAQSPAGTDFGATANVKKTFANARVVDIAVGKTNVPDGKTVNAYLVSLTGAPDPLKGDGRWRALPTTIQLADEDGEQTVYAWARATGGVVSARGSDTVFLDREKPEVSNVVTTPAQAEDEDPDPVITDRSVTVEFEYSDPGESDDPATGSGVSKYAVVNGTTLPIASSTAWKAAPNATGPVTVNHNVSSGNGSKTVSIFVKDRAGNASLATSVKFTLQVAGPSVTLTAPAYSKIQKPSIKVTATKNGNPVTGAQFYRVVTTTNDQPDAPTGKETKGWVLAPTTALMKEVGENWLWVWAMDSNGSVSASPASKKIIWDNVAPTVDFEFDETENDDDVDTTADRSVTWTGTTDAGVEGSPVTHWALKNGTAAPTSAEWKTIATALAEPWTVTLGNGDKTVTLWARDAAGNIGSDPDTIILTLPAPSMTVNMPAYSKSLTVTGISRTFNDAAGVGVAGYYFSETNTAPGTGATWLSAPSTFTFSAGQGNRTLYAWVKDKNGTISTLPATDTVFIDTVKPTATIEYDGVSKVITVGGSDAGSGIAFYAVLRTASGTIPSAPNFPNTSVWKSVAADAVSTITLQTGANQVTVYTRDEAGNISTVDQTEPDVSTLVITK